jgi:SNF2 family DNA or RNA helicase
LIDIAEHARVKLILSGTPMPQSGRDLYSQLNVLWPAGRLTGPADSFSARVDRDFRSVLTEVLPFVSRAPKEALGLPQYEIQRHETALGGIQAEVYDLIESNFRRRIAGAVAWKDKLDRLRRGRPIRLLQAAANPDLLNRADSYYKLPRIEGTSATLMERLLAYRDLEVPAKSVAALELLRSLTDSGEKVVCWSNFVSNLDQFSALVRAKLNVTCFQIDGRVPTDDEPSDDNPTMARANPRDGDTRERIIEQFLGHVGSAVLVTNPASCSESISLHHGCHTAIYLDRTYDSAQFLQSIDRIHRIGLPANVTVHIHLLLATLNNRATIDGLVDMSLARKEGAMKQLLEGAELAPISLSNDPLDDAEGDEADLSALLRFLLGEDM